MQNSGPTGQFDARVESWRELLQAQSSMDNSIRGATAEATLGSRAARKWWRAAGRLRAASR